MVRLTERVLRLTTYKGREIDTIEVMFFVLIGFSCLLQLIGNTQPGSIALLLPQTFRTVWLGAMLLGSIAGLAGIFWPRRIVDAILLEIVGLAWVSIALVVYGSAQGVAVVVSESPLGGLMSGALTILIGLGFSIKALRLQGVIERLKKQ